jgi:hypothetical protein
MCTPQCAVVARDHRPNVEAGGPTAPHSEAGGQTATPGGPTGYRRRATAQSCALPAIAVVEAIIMARRTVEDDEASPPVGGNFQSAAA